MAPGVALQQPIPGPADPVAGRAVLEFADPVMLAAKCYEICHAGLVAAFNVAAQELAALGKSDGVDCRGFGENGVRCQICADFLDLEGKVSQECSGPIRGGIVVKMDIVSKCPRVCLVQKLPN